MTKSATDLMQEILFAAVLDSMAAFKTASKGLPNNLLRDLSALHGNTTFGDLPAEVQAAIAASVRSGFNRLLKEGYSVSSAQGGAAALPPRRPPAGAPRGPGGDRSPPRGGRPGGHPSRKPGGRPGGKPNPSGPRKPRG